MMVRRRAAAAIRAYDYLVAIAFGCTACVASWWLVPASLPGILAMLVGMAIGLVAAVPVLAAASVVLGGFEVLVMSMQIGMAAGMVGGMFPSASVGTVLSAGAGVGIAVHAVLHVMDRAKRGEVRS